MTLDITAAVGEATRGLGIQHLPSVPPRRPQATGEFAFITIPDTYRTVPYVLPEGWQWAGPQHRRGPLGWARRLIGGAW